MAALTHITGLVSVPLRSELSALHATAPLALAPQTHTRTRHSEVLPRRPRALSAQV